MELRAKQQRFCEEYLKDFNATQAAIRAGYSKHTAAVIGNENLIKPYIKDYIKKRLDELFLTEEETKKMMSDMARGNLSNYYTTKKVEHTPRIEVGLKQIIDIIKAEIEFEREFSELANYNEDEMNNFYAAQDRRRREIIRHELRLKKNPKATDIVNGPTVWVEVAELDMMKVIADKERGKIKSVTPTQFGTKVELYAADTALVNVAKIHGLFAKDNAQLKPEIIIPSTPAQIIVVPGRNGELEIMEDE